MIHQLKSIVGFKEEEIVEEKSEVGSNDQPEGKKNKIEMDSELMKTRVDSLGLSGRTTKALAAANVRTLGGLARKKESDIMDIDGLGAKGIQEIKKLLAEHGVTMKQ